MTTTYFSPNLLAALLTALTIKFSIKDLKLETADSVTFTEDILNGKLHFLCSNYSFITFSGISVTPKKKKLQKGLILRGRVGTRL